MSPFLSHVHVSFFVPLGMSLSVLLFLYTWVLQLNWLSGRAFRTLWFNTAQGRADAATYADGVTTEQSDVSEIETTTCAEWTVDLPVAMHRQVPNIQTGRRTCEVPQILCLDRVVDALVVTQRQMPMNHKVQRTVEIRQAGFIAELLMFLSSCRGSWPPFERFRKYPSFHTERSRRNSLTRQSRTDSLRS